MDSKVNNSKMLFDLAMSVGNSLDLYEMLIGSLNGYIRNLDCTGGAVFRLKYADPDTYTCEPLASLPYTLCLRGDTQELCECLPRSFTSTELREFRQSLPMAARQQNGSHYLVMKLGDFGFLLLLDKNEEFDSELIPDLLQVNGRLAMACNNCLNFEKSEEGNTRYRHQQTLIPEMVCETDMQGRITYANGYAYDRLGYTYEDLKKGVTIFDLVHPADAVRLKENFARSLSIDRPPSEKYTLVRKDGKSVPVLTYSNRLIRNDRVDGLVAIVVDISDLTEKEKKLEQYTERLELALMGSDAGLWDWNIATGEVFYSERWCSMLGYSYEEIESTINAWEKLMHPDDKVWVLEVLKDHMDNKTPLYRTEHRIKAKSGEYKWFLDLGKVTARDELGKPLRAVGMQIDISERKKAELLSGIEHELSLKLSKAHNLDETIRICLEFATSYSGMDCGGIYIEDETAGGFRLIQHTGLDEEFVSKTSYYPNDSFNARVILEGKPVYTIHEKMVKDRETPPVKPLKAIAVLPILYLNRSIGCINIGSKTHENIDEFSKNILEKIASYIGSFIIQARNEDKLRQNQQDLNTLFNTIDDFLFILDMEGNMIYFNDTVTERLGYTPEELMTRHVLLVHPPARHEEATRVINAMLMGTETVCTVPLRCRDGSEIPVDTKVKIGKWSGKDVIIGTSRDTTDHRSYEKQIRENAERLEMALMASDAGMWDWNLKTNEVKVNERWKTLRGIEGATGAFTVDSWMELLHPDDAAPTIEALKLHVEGTEPFYQAEYRSRNMKGEYIWILDAGKIMEYDNEGKPLRVVGTNISINAKKENEITLQQNLRQQELLSYIALELNSIGDFDVRISEILKKIGQHTGVSRVYIFEDTADGLATDNTYEWCNDGITPQIDELQGVPYEAIPSWKKLFFEQGCVFSDNISELPEDLRAILEPQDIKSIIVHPLYVNGQYYGFAGFDECVRTKQWSRLELELLRTISGIIANAFERKKMDQSIIDERDRANEANRAKSEFLANMSHEIRTPMNAILGFSEALYHKLESPQHKKMVSSVLSSGNLLLSLLNDILDLSKIEAGKLDILTHPVDIRNILQEIKLIFTEKAVKKGIEINIFMDNKFPEILMIDEIRVKQVVFNLVGNAVKFTHRGYININVSFLSATPESGTMTVEVEDTGIGIPESQQDVIFEAFRQQSGQSNRMYGGIGLGLAISRRLVEKMNGSISVSSSVGRGSVFQVVIPEVQIAGSEMLVKNTGDLQEDVKFEKANILVVDDVRSNIDTIENLLPSEELTVISADSGEAALKILDSSKPEMILIDIRMPNMNGYELAKKIRACDTNRGIPVIAFTASVFSVDKIESEKTFDGILLKPVSRDNLFSVLKRHLRYTSIRNDKPARQSEEAGLDRLPAFVLARLPELYEKLSTDYMVRWEMIKDQLVLFRIEEFASDLKKLAASFHFSYLGAYADQILSDLEIVDLDSLRETLMDFPKINNRIKTLINSKKHE